MGFAASRNHPGDRMSSAVHPSQRVVSGGWKELSEYYHAPCGKFLNRMKPHICKRPVEKAMPHDEKQTIKLSFVQAVGLVADVMNVPGRDWKNATIAEFARELVTKLGWK